MSEADIEKKIALSLDELIAQQKAKQANKPKPKAKAAAAAGGKKKGAQRVQKVQTKSGGRVLVVPRPKHVPRPNGNLKATRGGGVHKGGAAPKYMGGGGGGGVRQGGNRNVKVTIGNKLSGRPAGHIPTSGVLSKPFLGGGGGGGGRSSGYNGGGRAAMQVEGVPAGSSLSSRFDSLAGVAPSGPARPTGAPRRNAHGVVLP
ncbi:hypothetical protein C2E21_7055 [Chlorella sorokiniana]|jgi:hypothetical protein|uniref:Uncharacterized protein n=1 Tax=Chlorella sorokiniana TaxID=3076 RepID=A0A2P6TJI4_CHLSO|nr:hypothetical protein C2E21_7055 [Chlorella sorokiniana]|eukprot:PRW39372.1 hypothetical protein C2E21_7055 [Chlorella sorokiniana]